MKTIQIGILTLLMIVVCGCGEKFIPNTEIEDNEDNRAIVNFCERYRHAVEDLNIGLLLSLAAPRYFDNSGTPSGDDDIDLPELEEILKERFKAIKSLRYEIRYRNVYEVQDVVMVEYTYTMNCQYEIGEKTRWVNKTADNRLELERVDGGFRILTGM
jgi:hypothetical protein